MLARKEVPVLLMPRAQEVSRLQCDIGHDAGELRELLGEEGTLPEGFGLERLEWGDVIEGWNSKVCCF